MPGSDAPGGVSMTGMGGMSGSGMSGISGDAMASNFVPGGASPQQIGVDAQMIPGASSSTTPPPPTGSGEDLIDPATLPTEFMEEATTQTEEVEPE